MNLLKLKENLDNLQERIKKACDKAKRKASDVRPIAVTKTVSAETAACLYELGFRHFGENRCQIAKEKMDILRDLDITWHFIGHLQTNKVKEALVSFSEIHSVDRLALVEEIEKHLTANPFICLGSKFPVYLQMNISGEVTKSGATKEESYLLIERLTHSKQMHLAGLMTMAPESADERGLRSVFGGLRDHRDHLQRLLKVEIPRLSMGMSNDFEIAIEEGATDIRIGSLIFNGVQGDSTQF